MSNNCSFKQQQQQKIKVIIWRPLQRVWVSSNSNEQKKNKTMRNDMPSITPKSRRRLEAEKKHNSLIFLNQNIYVMNVNFSSLEYLWSSILTAGAIVVAAIAQTD